MSEVISKEEIFQDFQKRYAKIDDIVDISVVDKGVIVVTTKSDGVYEYDWYAKTVLWKKTIDELNTYHRGTTEKNWRAEFGRRLLHKLQEENLSVYQMSDMANISYKQLYNYINGLVTPSAYRVRDFERLLGCSPGYLVNF